MPPMRLLACLVLVPALASALQAQRAPATPPVDSTFFALNTRNIGPSGMSGRVAAIAAVPSNLNIVYVGTATGGVWKTTDGGITWAPIFDDQATSSIGDVAVFGPNPDIVWVGTGEGNPRNSVGVGRGVYKSMNGGRDWTFLGLPNSERIHRVLLDPRDPDIAFLGVMGPTWSDGDERGVYRTTDGGRTWERTLFVNASTGAADLVMDPANPNHLIAAMWDHRRQPWTMRSGGTGSGLHVTWDGGRTWKKLTDKDGLPKGELGRIALAFARNNPSVVYALVEAAKSALLRSDDGGNTWRIVNDQPNVSPRPFYFSDIRVDPTNENRIYRLGGNLDFSEDGGRTFRALAGFTHVHPDHHALWIEPTRGEMMINGNDGGVYFTQNKGRTWRFVDNLPLAQFYHVSTDNALPFNVYGGLQDNGSWMGPSAVWGRPGFAGPGIQASEWKTVGFGDGFAVIVDTKDPSYAYSMSQGGYINRIDLRTGEWKSVRPPRPADGTRLRFNWNAGIASDPHQAGTLYYGSQFVHKSTDRGNTWTIVSPDLTTNDTTKQKQAESGGLTKDVTAAENHTTIMTIAPSPAQSGVMWVGTDDGNVQLTRDGGATWTNVGRNIRGVPVATWVPHIEASKRDAATAYVVFDNHRRGDWTTYVFKTTDFGRTWTSLATPQIDGFAHTIEDDPIEPNLLFLGTEFGMYMTTDGGRSWEKWRAGGFPTVPVHEFAIHPRDHALVIGTHGRAVWVVDDLEPLRQLAREAAMATRPLAVFQPTPAYQHANQIAGPYYFPGHDRFLGENAPYGATISYHIGGPRSAASDTAKATIQIVGANGAVIRELTGKASPGVQRVTWDLRERGFRMILPPDIPEEFLPTGPEVLPGRYTVRVRANGSTADTQLEVRGDPRREVQVAVRGQKRDALTRAGRTIERTTDGVLRLRMLSRQLDFAQQTLRDTASLRVGGSTLDSAARARLNTRIDSVKTRLNKLMDQLRLPDNTVGIVEDESAASQLGEIYGALASSTDDPTAGQLDELRRREEILTRVLNEVDAFLAGEGAAVRRELTSAGIV
jgi:photosystem II stability/assembly factor-like uncharacterized protein